MSNHETRLEALESKLAFQEDTIQQLNDALIAQQGRIDRLEAMLKLVAEQAGGIDRLSDAAVESPPPHY